MGHGNPLYERVLVVVSLVVLAAGTFLSYTTAKEIMCGDRIMQKFPPGYLGLTMSNKNWLLLILLAVIGGSLGYIVYKVVKRLVKLSRR